MKTSPILISGGLVTDDRGVLQFANDFHLGEYKRFYVIRNHQPRFVRAWHGHKHEGKAFTVTAGAAVVGAIKIDDWSQPNRSATPERVVLSAENPSVYVVPPGFANGVMTLRPETQVLVFSTLTLNDAISDDIRFNSRFWDIWNVEER